MPMRHKIVLVGHDKAPSVALEMAGNRLREEFARDSVTADVLTFCAHGAPPLDKPLRIAAEALDATFVVTGVSSSEELATEEIETARLTRAHILKARAKGEQPDVQYGVYLDTDMGNRDWFDDAVADEVSFAFAPNADEVMAAQKRYPKARVFLTGNPLEEAAAFPVTTREGIRATFNVADEQPLILCPGGKDLHVNSEFLKGVADAIRTHAVLRFDPFVIFSPHPGDQNDPEAYVELLEDLYNYRVRWELVASPPLLDQKHTRHEKYAALQNERRISDEVFPASHLIPGADIVVHSASTIAKEAGYQRKPAVNYFTAAAFDRNPDLRQWPPVTRGVEEAVYEDPAALTETIQRLLTPEGFAPMRARQEAVYLAPRYRGAAVEKIVAAIREIAGV